MSQKKIAIAISGASGSIYAKLLLDRLSKLSSHYSALDIVMSDNAKTVWETELGNKAYENYDFKFWDKRNFMAPFASGSAQYTDMIIVPCSMGTLGRIAAGISDDLTTRAADVMLKERKRLILVTRETPLNLIQINNMKTVTEAGAIVCPASPSFYSNPKSIEEACNTVVSRILDLIEIKDESYRWGSK